VGKARKSLTPRLELFILVLQLAYRDFTRQKQRRNNLSQPLVMVNMRTTSSTHLKNHHNNVEIAHLIIVLAAKPTLTNQGLRRKSRK
jgi:hypothetical protein